MGDAISAVLLLVNLVQIENRVGVLPHLPLLQIEGGLDGKAPRTVNEATPLKELQSIVEALLTYSVQDFRRWRKENHRKSIEVLSTQLYARVG